MNERVKYILNRPLMFSIGIIVIAIACTFIPMPGLAGAIGDAQVGEYVVGIIEQTAVSIALIIGIKQLGLLEKAGFKGRACKVWIIWPMVLFVLLMSLDFIGGSKHIDYTKPGTITTFILVYLSTGLFEETLCRGVVFTLMLNKWGKTVGGCYLALICSSVLFGSTHFIHFILGHESLIATVNQVVYAAFFGVFFASCVVKCKSIYPAMILHGIVDIAGDLNEIAVNGGVNKAYRTMSVGDAVTSCMMILPFMIYGLWIVSKEFKKSIRDK